MLEPGKIDSRQAAMLMVSLVLPTAIFTVPGITVKTARQDAWVSILAATLAGLLIALLVANLSLRFPGKTLFEYAEEILGKAPGKAVGLLYLWWFLHTNSIIISEFSSFLCTAILPKTPFIVLHVVTIFVVAYLVRSGLEVLSRFNQIFLPLVLGLLVVVFILAATEMKAVRLLPVLDARPAEILKGAAVPLSLLGEIVAFAMIAPYLNRPRAACRVAALATLFTGFFMLLTTLVAIAVFGPHATGKMIFSTYNSVRVISIANFLERLETVVVMAWVFGGFAKIGIFYYAAVLGSAQWLGLSDYRPLVAPVGVILVALAVISCRNVVEMVDFIAVTWPPYSLSIFELGMPLALLTVALLRGKGAKGF
ncbi:MAG: endospore germination permease [Syntrophomonadaceae bacterium]|nr:endospore germination permease [Syntrophomonadaceae bacterium]